MLTNNRRAFHTTALIVGVGVAAHLARLSLHRLPLMGSRQRYRCDDDKDRLIKTGHVVCALLDQGANNATVKAEVIIHHSTGKEQSGDGGYWANLFIQTAAIAYCPWQPAANWDI